VKIHGHDGAGSAQPLARTIDDLHALAFEMRDNAANRFLSQQAKISAAGDRTFRDGRRCTYVLKADLLNAELE
jgi:hypothetical protein